MLEYLFDTEYSARFFGKIEEKHFNSSEYTKTPEFIKKVGGWDNFKAHTNCAIATVIIAEETYCDNIVTMRVYASSLSDTVILIDEAYDTNHTIFPDEIFHGFPYVKNKKDAATRIQQLKDVDTLFVNILSLQRIQLQTDRTDFYNEFNKLLLKELE